jgi:hypothetical protein
VRIAVGIRYSITVNPLDQCIDLDPNIVFNPIAARRGMVQPIATAPTSTLAIQSLPSKTGVTAICLASICAKISVAVCIFD